MTVAASHLASIAELVQRLRKAGMEVEQVPPVIGVITGTVPASSSLGSLSAVVGVASIEQQRQFRIPSPDAVVQ